MKDAKGHGSNAKGGNTSAAYATGTARHRVIRTEGWEKKGVHAAQIAALPTKQAMQQTGNSRELKMFGDNDGNLYRQSQQPIEANLSKKIAAGTYDHDLATKLWGYHADRAAQAYTKQFGSPGDKWHQMFSPGDRRAAATQWANEFRTEHALRSK